MSSTPRTPPQKSSSPFYQPESSSSEMDVSYDSPPLVVNRLTTVGGSRPTLYDNINQWSSIDERQRAARAYRESQVLAERSPFDSPTFQTRSSSANALGNGQGWYVSSTYVPVVPPKERLSAYGTPSPSTPRRQGPGRKAGRDVLADPTVLRSARDPVCRFLTPDLQRLATPKPGTNRPYGYRTPIDPRLMNQGPFHQSHDSEIDGNNSGDAATDKENQWHGSLSYGRPIHSDGPQEETSRPKKRSYVELHDDEPHYETPNQPRANPLRASRRRYEVRWNDDDWVVD